MEKIEELQKVCEPVVDYLRENHDPHTKVVVTQDSIELQVVQIGIPVKD